MRVGSGLLIQLERCGLSAKLSDEHAEVSEDRSGSRATRREIARAFHANDQAALPEAQAALLWLTSEPGDPVSLEEPIDLIDQTTGEVLVTGKPGAVLANPGLVVAWKMANAFNDSEPEEDLGLLAMGLASSNGQPFRVAHVALRGDEVFPRRSPVIEPAQHPALLDRIKSAVSRPRIACPGDWCGACRQNVYCEAWRARAKVALTVLGEEAPLTENAEGEAQIPQLDLTSEIAGAVMARIKTVEKVAELAKEQVKAFVRKGGRCVVDGKEYYPGSRDGKESVDIKALKAAGHTEFVKKGQPYEQFSWRKVRPAR